MSTPTTAARSIYELITGDHEAVCDDLPEAACREVPRNFTLNALNGTATKFAEQIASPELTLPWFLDALGVPASLTGFLIPVRRAGALLPQLIVAGQIRQFPVRRWFWVGGGLAFALGLFAMLPAGLLLRGSAAGAAVLVALALGSVGRGVCSVAFKDVLAKTIPSGRRGRLLATRAAAGGLLAVSAGIALRRFVGQASDELIYVWLVAGAGLLWLIGATLMGAIREHPGTTGGGRNAIQELGAGVEKLSQVPGFRRFVIARVVLLTIELSLPFYALYGRQLTGGQAADLGVFLVAAAVAQVISSPLWGRFADASSRQVMIISGLMAALAGSLALALGGMRAEQGSAYAFGIVLLAVGISRAGVRLGRKTYLVDGAPPLDRPLYVALSNTIVGAATLVGGGLGYLAQALGVRALIALLALLAALGAGASWLLPEAAHMADPHL